MNEGQQMLHDTLSWVAPHVKIGSAIPGFGTDAGSAAVVATALLARAERQGRAVLHISMSDIPETAASNLRSLAEAYAETNYLLAGSPSEQQEKAHTAFVFALKQLASYHEKYGAGTPDHAAIAAELAAKTLEAPVAAAATKSGANFWTPSRSKLLQDAFATWGDGSGNMLGSDSGGQLYKLLSWEEHHVVALLQNVDLAEESPTGGTIRIPAGANDPQHFFPFLAAGILARMLQLYEGVLAALNSPKDAGAS